jgi:hypothetical protein
MVRPAWIMTLLFKHPAVAEMTRKTKETEEGTQIADNDAWC